MKKRLLLLICLAGVLLVIVGAIFNPSFIARYLSSDGVLDTDTINRVLSLQIYALTIGCLIVFGSVLAYNKGLVKILFLPLLIVYLLLVQTRYVSQVYPGNIFLKPSEFIKIWNVLLGKDLLLTDYQPKSMLVVENHQVMRAKYPVINVHTHFTHWIEKMSREEIIKIMDDCGVEKVVDLDGSSGEFEDKIADYKNKYPDRFILFYHVWFRDGVISDSYFSEKVLDFEKAVKMGARGLKIWKNLGLKAKDSSEKIIPVDDPRLDPLWAKAGELGVPVLIHVTDRDSFFTPVDRFNEHFEELQGFSEWVFYGPGFPSKMTVLGQFENIVKKHPGTIFIGAHMAMKAEDLSYVGSLLDKYPNLYVEISAQVPELGREPYTSRRFFIKYQDRILFGTDGNPREMDYRSYFRFLETADEYFDYPFSEHQSFGRWKIYGIYLPDEVLKKVYYINAAKILKLHKTI